MTLGLILECTPGGPDEKVFRHWIGAHLPEVTKLHIDTLLNKRNLVARCGAAAKDLLEMGCERVIIVWDLYPAWEGKKQSPCLHDDRTKAFAALDAAEVPLDRIALVAIESMLECWFLADERALASFLSEKLRREITAQQIGRLNSPPEKQRRPKDMLSSKFEKQKGSRYLDFNDAEAIAKHIDIARLRGKRCPTFERFWTKISGEAV
jgi:hypothetical protein